MDTVAKKDVIIPLVPAAPQRPAARRRCDRLFGVRATGPTDRGCTATSARTWWPAAAVGLIALYGASSLVKNKPVRLALLALAVIASVVVFFIPGGICPLCAMKTMRCHIVFQPFVRIMSVLVAGSGVGALVASWKKAAKPSA